VSEFLVVLILVFAHHTMLKLQVDFHFDFSLFVEVVYVVLLFYFGVFSPFNLLAAFLYIKQPLCLRFSCA
jgi:hypothetical protein